MSIPRIIDKLIEPYFFHVIAIDWGYWSQSSYSNNYFETYTGADKVPNAHTSSQDKNQKIAGATKLFARSLKLKT